MKSKWRTGLPTNDDLGVIFNRPGYTTLGGLFMVDTCAGVNIAQFRRPPKGKGWYPGYWMGFEHEEVYGWQPLPERTERGKAREEEAKR